MNSILKNLQPKKVWQYFNEISQIPRTSTNETKITNFLFDLLKTLRPNEIYRDKFNNIVARFNANNHTYAKRPLITLQAHSDMVGAKGSHNKHDFLKDPIKLKKNKQYVFANGTTLGADDGIGIAMMLAVISDRNIHHGPIEILITSDEEIGQTGAKNLDKSKLKGKYLISLDGYDQNKVFIGSAAAVAQQCKIPVTTSVDFTKNNVINNDEHKTAMERVLDFGKKTISELVKFNKNFSVTDKIYMSLNISRLIGGHVALGMGKPTHIQSAIEELFYILYLLSNRVTLNIVDVHGGQATNSLPTDCHATILIDAKDKKVVHEIFNNRVKYLKRTFRDEKNAIYKINEIESNKPFICLEDTKKIINFINCFHTGIHKYDHENKIYNACTYIGTIKFDGKTITLWGGCRAMSKDGIDKETSYMRCLCQLLNIKYSEMKTCAEWTPNFNNKLAKLMCAKLNKKHIAKIEYTLGGCEAAEFLSSKHTHFIDGILWGPTMYDMHSPNERLNIKSVSESFEALCYVIKNLH